MPLSVWLQLLQQYGLPSLAQRQLRCLLDSVRHWMRQWTQQDLVSRMQERGQLSLARLQRNEVTTFAQMCGIQVFGVNGHRERPWHQSKVGVFLHCGRQLNKAAGEPWNWCVDGM